MSEPFFSFEPSRKLTRKLNPKQRLELRRWLNKCAKVVADNFDMDALHREVSLNCGVPIHMMKTPEQVKATRRRSLRAKLGHVRRKNGNRMTATEIDLQNKIRLLA